MKDKNILIGICGGIASYKVCDIITALKHMGANVYVMMTKNATEFITPLTLETLSKNKVVVDMFESHDHVEVEHISYARRADLTIIIPATANVIGKVANGIADDFLTTTIMATPNKVIFAPSMNNGMYENKIVQNNIKKLESFGYSFIEPDVGNLACGYTAKGKLPKKEKILKYIESEFDNNE